MSDETPISGRQGSAVDRKPSPTNAVASGAGIGLVIALTDYAIKSYTGGHWHYVIPDDALIELASPIIILPFAQFCLRVFQLIGRIITNHLEKEAGAE
jgi:hypothetical protein